MSEKRFPASEVRLRKLRADGVFPRSLMLRLGGVGAGLIANLEIIKRQGATLPEALKGLTQQGEPLVALRQAAVLTFSWTLILVLTLVACRMVVGLIEARGGMWWGRVGPNFMRLLPGQRGADGSGGGWWSVRGMTKLGGKLACLGALSWIFILVSQWFVGYWPQRAIELTVQSAQASTSAAVVPTELFRLLSGAIYALGGALMFLGLIGYMFAVIIFRREQMMTRDEMMAEGREQEGSDYRRRALSELRTGQ